MAIFPNLSTVHKCQYILISYVADEKFNAIPILLPL